MDIEKISGEKQDKCTFCGECKRECPVYLVTKKEIDSPRFKAYLMRQIDFNNLTEESFASLGVTFDEVKNSFLKCTLCGACVVNCPNGVDLEFRKVRESLQKFAKKDVQVEYNSIDFSEDEESDLE